MENLECPQCGNTLTKGVAVCGACGKEIKDDKSTIPAQNIESKTGSNKIYALIAVVLIVLGGVALLIFTGLLPNPMKGSSAAAIVNGEKILVSEVDQKIDLYKKMSGPGAQPDAATPEGKAAMANMRTQILSKLIQEKILATEAAKQKIVVTPQEIAGRITSIKQGMKFSDKDFELFLKNHAMTPAAFEKRTENDLMIGKLIAKETKEKGLTADALIAELNKKAAVEVLAK